jgi:hypothetical protein
MRNAWVRVAIKQRTVLCLSIAALVAVYVLSVQYIQPANSCYGPHITSEIDRTQININETD